MGLYGVAAIVVYLSFTVIAVKKVMTRRGRVSIGPGAAGAYYDMLSQDRREAIEVIVEKRAEKQDPEDRDGNLPDLTGPR